MVISHDLCSIELFEGQNWLTRVYNTHFHIEPFELKSSYVATFDNIRRKKQLNNIMKFDEYNVA